MTDRDKRKELGGRSGGHIADEPENYKVYEMGRRADGLL
jgi:hypothetical protein